MPTRHFDLCFLYFNVNSRRVTVWLAHSSSVSFQSRDTHKRNAVCTRGWEGWKEVEFIFCRFFVQQVSRLKSSTVGPDREGEGKRIYTRHRIHRHGQHLVEEKLVEVFSVKALAPSKSMTVEMPQQQILGVK